MLRVSGLIGLHVGGDKTRSGYVRYVQGIQPYVPAFTAWRNGLYNSMVRSYAIAIAIARTNLPLSSTRTWTPFHHPLHVSSFVVTGHRFINVLLTRRKVWNNRRPVDRIKMQFNEVYGDTVGSVSMAVASGNVALVRSIFFTFPLSYNHGKAMLLQLWAW